MPVVSAPAPAVPCTAPEFLFKIPRENFHGSRTDNQPGAVRTSVGRIADLAVPCEGHDFWKIIIVARADNQPQAERAIHVRRASGRISEAPAGIGKISGRRTDNQPGAVRTSVWIAATAAVPCERRPFLEKVPSADIRAKAAMAAGWTTLDVGAGEVNNIAAASGVVKIS